MTFSQFIDVHLERLAKREYSPVKITSIESRRSLLHTAASVLGDMEVTEIKSGHLKTLAETLNAQDYKPGSIDTIVTAAMVAIKSDVNEHGEPRNQHEWAKRSFIFERVGGIAGDKQRKSLAVTGKQIEEAIVRLRAPLREFVILQAATGCRKGELLALRVADFDATHGFIRVTKTRSQYGESTTKTQAGTREVDVAPEIAAMLSGMLAGRTTGNLFERDGKPVSLKQVRYAFERLGIQSHSLRHFRYTQLQKSKVHPAIHNFWIGHSMSGMSRIYGHVHEDRELRQRLVREVGLGFEIAA